MCVSICNVLSVYERDSVCVHRPVMSRVFMRAIVCVCVCVSICNVLSVYERDSVCVYRSVMSRVFMREIVCVCIGL